MLKMQVLGMEECTVYVISMDFWVVVFIKTDETVLFFE